MPLCSERSSDDCVMFTVLHGLQMKVWENQPHSFGGATLAVAETTERTDELVEIAVHDSYR